MRKQLSADLRRYWPLWLIVALAIFLRLYEIGRVPGMNGDEGWYGLQARLWLAGEDVAWRTPTGNVPGLLHLWSLILLHTAFAPSLLLLRVPALVSSLAAIALAYATGRRFFGPAAGVSAAVLMACLPINIAYARLGWDPSHSSLLVLAAAYAAFAGRKFLSALLFALAVANHPSAVFVAPFLTLSFLGFNVPRQGWHRAIANTAQQAGLLVLAILLGAALSPAAGHYLSLARSLGRVVDFSAWANFGLKFCQLLSGDTIYAYVVGNGLGGARPWVDAIIALGLAAIVGAGLLSLRRHANWPTSGVLAGCLASLALLYLVAGPWVLDPKLERFAVPMIPLTALALAALLELILARHRQWLPPLLAAIALPMLGGFWLYYMQPLKDGKIQPMRGFWTAEQDPGRLAYERIAADAAPTGGGRIIAENWWLYMPIAYYAVGQPLTVAGARAGEQPPAGAKAGPTYWVTYDGGMLDQTLARRKDVRRRWTIATANPRNRIQIWWKPGGPAATQ